MFGDALCYVTEAKNLEGSGGSKAQTLVAEGSYTERTTRKQEYSDSF